MILSNFFEKVEDKQEINLADSDATPTETDAKIKFEFGTESTFDEPSPKTPEFSEIAETIAEKTIM